MKLRFKVAVWNEKKVRSLLPQRKPSHHKALSGKVLVLGGDKEMLGAGLLSALAAARSGAGYVYLAAPAFSFKVPLQVYHPDVLFIDPRTMRNKTKKIDLNRFQSLVLGPGLKPDAKTWAWIKFVKKNFKGSIVLDAGALEVLAKRYSKDPIELGSNWLFTPHEGEMAKLLGCNPDWVRENREKSVFLAHRRYKAGVLLKGAETLVMVHSRLNKISTGTPALSKAGTGDVLAGMIAAFLAQGLSVEASACVASVIHGLSARNWLKKSRDVLGLLATDLLVEIPETLHKVRQNR